MNKKDSLGDRMKGYENIPRTYLIRRMPCIIRIDGKAFHTFTRGFQRPFDEVFMKTMWETTKYLCENIQGCKIAYTQSDEISLLFTDYDELTTSAWFDKNIQKMVSVSASMATLAFNNAFARNIFTLKYDNYNNKMSDTYLKKTNTALFDSRVFTIPKEDVCNYFVWRQQDATRNAIQMVGRGNFSDKELHKVNCNQIQEKLFQEKGINFNDLPVYQKRGICVIKKSFIKENEKPLITGSGIYFEGQVERTEWTIDDNIPVFTQNREYIEKFI